MATLPPKIAMLIIGDEILSGKTQDSNLKTLAAKMGEKGYSLAEARVVPDSEEKIITSLVELKKEYKYVFTSGGIGPTHDDITSLAVAKACSVNLELNKEADRILSNHYANLKLEYNDARKKMAMIPKGADLIYNKISKAPGFKIENIFVLAGIPAIFTDMLEEIVQNIEYGVKMYSECIVIEGFTEGEIAKNLQAVQNHFKEKVTIGSYPSFPKKNDKGKHFIEIVLRGVNQEEITKCKREIEEILTRN